MTIVLIGGTGTGKSTVGKLLSINLGYKVCEIGHVVKMMFYNETLKEYSKKYNNHIDVKNFTNEYFFSNKKEIFVKKRLDYVSNKVKTYGPDYFLKRILEKEKDNNLIIIGVRSKKEINTIKKHMKNPFFVALKCEENKLSNRFVKRELNRMDKDVAKFLFVKRRIIENKWGMEEEMENCNLVINTSNMKPTDICKNIINEYQKYILKNKKGIIFNEKRIIY